MKEVNTLGGRFQTHSTDFFISWASSEQAWIFILLQNNSAHLSLKQTNDHNELHVGNNVMDSLSVCTYMRITLT